MRMNYDLRDQDTDLSQRMINAIEPNSIIPIHRHPFTSETVILLRGSVEELFYDVNEDTKQATITNRYILSKKEGDIWHTYSKQPMA